MSSKPIQPPLDADLALALPALKRAAARAREVAKLTGTKLVYWRDGKVVRVSPGRREKGARGFS